MKSMRPLVAAATAAALSLALVVAPASAKKPKDPGPYTYIATIDCGSGAVEVGSWDDVWAPLVDLESGKQYMPVAWDIRVGTFVFQEYKHGEPKKRAVDCSYSDDSGAEGTVTVKKA